MAKTVYPSIVIFSEPDSPEKLRVDAKLLFPLVDPEHTLQRVEDGNVARKGYVLNKALDWKIGLDSLGRLVIIPMKKS